MAIQRHTPLETVKKLITHHLANEIHQHKVIKFVENLHPEMQEELARLGDKKHWEALARHPSYKLSQLARNANKIVELMPYDQLFVIGGIITYILSDAKAPLLAQRALKLAMKLPEQQHESLFNQRTMRTLSNLSNREFPRHEAIAQSYLQLGGNYFAKIVAENFGRLTPLKHGRIFNRLQFIKTGSKLRPLGGMMAGHLIRKIRIEAFQAWLKAHNDEELQGHVEPILHFKLNTNQKIARFKLKDKKKRSYVKVLSKYCGERSDIFMEKNPEHKEFVESEIERIRKRLNDIGVEHRHEGTQNFVVELKNGKPIVKIIDFDAAQIKGQEYEPDKNTEYLM